MIWFALILALVVGSIVGLFTRNLKKGILVGLVTLIVGVFLSLIIVFSGIMGG